MIYEPILWRTDLLVALIFILNNDDQQNCHSDEQDVVLLGGHMNLLYTRGIILLFWDKNLHF